MTRLGIGLLVIGAIVAFGISIAVEGANLQLIGYILMGGGLLALLVGLMRGEAGGARKMTTTRQASADGQTVVEERTID